VKRHREERGLDQPQYDEQEADRDPRATPVALVNVIEETRLNHPGRSVRRARAQTPQPRRKRPREGKRIESTLDALQGRRVGADVLNEAQLADRTVGPSHEQNGVGRPVPG
jgi:hypothetical protein